MKTTRTHRPQAIRRSRRTFTAIYEECEGWIAAHVVEIPGVNTQGRTMPEARDNLKEALSLVLTERRRMDAAERPASGVKEEKVTVEA